MPTHVRMLDPFFGVCYCHKRPQPNAGIFLMGSPDHKMENLGQTRLFDIGMTFCGHIVIAISGSPTSQTNNLPKPRSGDVVVGCLLGVNVSGTSTSIVDGG